MGNRWGNSGSNVRLYFLGSKITADGDCSHEIKRRLPLGRKVMTNLDSIFKSRDITLPTKVCLVNAMVFPVVMYGCESWTVKKAKCRRINAFELWCWRRLLRVPWTARRSNHSILKKISPGCSLAGLRLKLRLQYFGHLMGRVDSLEKTLVLGRIGGRGEGDNRGWDGWMASPTQWTWVWVDSRSWWWTGRLGMLWFMGSQRVGHDWATKLNWTEIFPLSFKSTYPNFYINLKVPNPYHFQNKIHHSYPSSPNLLFNVISNVYLTTSKQESWSSLTLSCQRPISKS